MKLAGFELTVDVDVAEHEVLAISVAFECDARLLPHGAVSAVAPDEVADDHLFGMAVVMTQRALNGVFPLHGVHEFDAALDRHAVTAQVAEEDAFRLRLRDEQDEREPRIVRRKT